MSSFRKISKTVQRTYKERSQPKAREHLGLLEKKKDYKLRADDHHKKANALKALRIKAQNRNKDEFYFGMVNSKMEDGVHQNKDTTPVYTDEQLKMFESQDLRYVRYKLSLERTKIEKLKSRLHMIDSTEKPKGMHLVFVDSKKEAEEFNASKYFNTHPDLVDSPFGRLTVDQLRENDLGAGVDDRTLAEIHLERKKLYEQLKKRIEREQELEIIEQKMIVKSALLDKKAKKKKVADETKTSAAIYRWVSERKR